MGYNYNRIFLEEMIQSEDILRHLGCVHSIARRNEYYQMMIVGIGVRDGMIMVCNVGFIGAL